MLFKKIIENLLKSIKYLVELKTKQKLPDSLATCGSFWNV